MKNIWLWLVVGVGAYLWWKDKQNGIPVVAATSPQAYTGGVPSTASYLDYATGIVSGELKFTPAMVPSTFSAGGTPIMVPLASSYM